MSARYKAHTRRPGGFDPTKAGAIQGEPAKRNTKRVARGQWRR
jgi:hypothetical protein